jgi:hypothetical protein
MPKLRQIYFCEHNGLKAESGEWPECLPASWKSLRGFPKEGERSFIAKNHDRSFVFCSCGRHIYFLDSGPARKYGFDEIGVFQKILVFKASRKIPEVRRKHVLLEIIERKLIEEVPNGDN